MRRGGVRGGGGGGGRSLYRFRLFRWLYTPCPATTDALHRVAVASGLRNVDELLVSLGKKDYEISWDDADQLLMEELGFDACKDVIKCNIYRAGKGQKQCNKLLGFYKESLAEGCEWKTRYDYDDLKKYCGYTDNELKAIRRMC